MRLPFLGQLCSPERRWSNIPRVYADIYEEWLRAVLLREALRQQKESLVVVNAWNEWAEGNHLEPCQRWGHGYLTATRKAIEAAKRQAAALAQFHVGQVLAPDPNYRLVGHVDA